MVKYMNDIENIEEIRNIPIGEMKFYKILEVLDDNWLVWFSCEWYYQDANKIDFSEADFLIFNKNYGFAVIEVKGGTITNDSRGKWYTNGNRFKKSPFHQAQNSMFFFRNNYIKAVESMRKKNELLNRFKDFPLSYLFLVAFPDCNYKKYLDIHQASINQNYIFDEDDLLVNIDWWKKGRKGTPPLEKWLIDQFKKRPKDNHGLSPDEICKFFIRTISDAVKTKVNLNNWLENKKKVFKKINKEQDRIINIFKFKSRAAFIGSAGTGKTFIAVKKIIHEFKYNDEVNVLYLCYNRALKGFVKDVLRTQLQQSHVTKIKGAHRITIRNIDDFISKLIKYYDKKIQSIKYNDYINAVRNNDQEKVIKIFTELVSKEKFETKYDVILIDEAQDFSKEYLKLIHFLLRDPEKSKIWIFYDNSQTIFQNDIERIPLDFMGLDTTQDKFFLSANLRNTNRIVEWYKNETDYGLYSEILSKSKQDVVCIEVESLSSAINEAVKIIEDLEKNLIELNRVVILGDYKFEILFKNKSNLNIVKKPIRKKQSTDYEFTSYELTRNGIIISEPSKDFFDAYNSPNHFYKNYKRVFYSSIGSYKGLESDIIILLLDKKMHSTKDKRRIYVGASRAKFLLYIIRYEQN